MCWSHLELPDPALAGFLPAGPKEAPRPQPTSHQPTKLVGSTGHPVFALAAGRGAVAVEGAAVAAHMRLWAHVVGGRVHLAARTTAQTPALLPMRLCCRASPVHVLCLCGSVQGLTHGTGTQRSPSMRCRRAWSTEGRRSLSWLRAAPRRHATACTLASGEGPWLRRPGPRSRGYAAPEKPEAEAECRPSPWPPPFAAGASCRPPRLTSASQVLPARC